MFDGYPMKKTFLLITLLAALTMVCGTLISLADDPSPKYTVEQIMKSVFKGDDTVSVAKKVGKGNGTQADMDKLVEYVSSLPLNDAPQGDPAGWKKKTTAVLDAVTALKAGKSDALVQYNKAVNCQACHSEYRPE
jgi:cytochrome c556